MHPTDTLFSLNVGSRKSIWQAVIGLFLLASSMAWAAPELTARLEPAEIRPGTYAAYFISITGGQPDADSTPKLPEGVELATANASKQISFSSINGVVTNTVVLGWQLTSNTPGEHVIPAQELHIGGVPFKCNAVTLTVKEDASSPSSQYDPLLVIEAAKREFYVGEVVPVTANLYVNLGARLRRVGLIEVPKDNFAIQRFPTQAEQSDIKMGGVPYVALAFESSLSGMKPGKFKLGPATSEIILDVPMQSGNFHPLFNQAEQRKVTPQSNEIEVTVLPLPETGKPQNFSGAVGDFEIHMTAEPHSVTVGDPIAVELTISGNGNFDALSAPAMTGSTQWKTYPARRYNVGSSNNASVGPQTASFSQVIIPMMQVEAIPSFEFNYFSPEKKQYMTLRTPPVPLQVKRAENPVEPRPATMESAAAATKDANQPDKVPQARAKITDILTLVSSSSPTWLSTRPPLWKDREFILANSAAAGGLLLLLGAKLAAVIFRRRSNDPHSVERRLWQQLNSKDMPRGQFYELAATYIHKKNLSGEALEPVLATHHLLNYGKPSEEASAALSPEEKDKVLHALQS